MKILRSLLLAASAAFVASCSSGIVMKSYYPSQAGVKRGESLVVVTDSASEEAYKLVNDIKKKLETKNYYRMGADGGSILYLHDVDVDINSYYHRNGNYKAEVTLSGDVSMVSGGAVTYSKRHSFDDSGIIYRDSRDECK